MNEMAVMKLYMDTTGASEATARSVLMHVIGESREGDKTPNQILRSKWKLREDGDFRSTAKELMQSGLVPVPA